MKKIQDMDAKEKAALLRSIAKVQKSNRCKISGRVFNEETMKICSSKIQEILKSIG